MKITIDNRIIKVDQPATILKIAEQNEIYIPSLCDHPDLTPYGGCRLCVVEVEGMKGYPTACTTIAEEGMVIRTHTKVLQEIRRDLIQLILSEHPAACLMCEDIEGCTGYQETIRKVGITTGCRWCPKDKDCEFQRIVESLDIDELTLPGLYRDIPLEKYDPFFDRDYNLCIYCGRCVRICHEYRKSSVLSLKQRGKKTTIGPAFEATHIDADCEFCGACVSVCPTGAMSEKSRKWWGVPEKYEPSICPLCSLNCEIQALLLKNKIVGTIPPGKPHESGGELCVKGRFCLSEIVNRTERILEPQYRYDEGYGFVSWETAFEKTKEILQTIEPNRSAVFFSPSLSLEEILMGKFFAEKVLKTNHFTSSFLDENLLAYMNLDKQSDSLKKIEKAGSVISVFLNGNYRFAPLTMLIKSAAARNIPYFQIGWLKDTTSRFATQRLIPTSGEEVDYFNRILISLETGKNDMKDISRLVTALKSKKPAVIVIGPEIMSLSNCISILEKIQQITSITKSLLFMPNQFGNLNGLLSLVKMKTQAEIDKLIKNKKIDLLYLIGDFPSNEKPGSKHIIYQNAFPVPEGSNPNVIFPVSLWGENGGSFLNADGKVVKFKAVAVKHGYSRSHEEIFLGLAKSMKISFPEISLKDIDRSHIHQKKVRSIPVLNPSGNMIKISNPDGKFPFLLIQEKAQHIYSNLNLSKGVKGFGELVIPDQIVLNPVDAKKLGVINGDTIWLVSKKNTKQYALIMRKNISPGYIYLNTLNGELEFESNPCPVNIRRENV